MKHTRRTEITIETHRVAVIRKRGERMVGYCEHCGRETTIIRVEEASEKPKLVCSRAIESAAAEINTQNDYEK